MNFHYVDYVVGDAREIVTVAILPALCGNHRFTATPKATAGRCTTKLEHNKSSGIKNVRFILAGHQNEPNR